MNLGDTITAAERAGALAFLRATMGDDAKLEGIYVAECIGADGKVKWRDVFPNLVVNVGKNLMLDTALAGSAYTVTGPFMGLVSSASFSAYNAADTMASHAGWLEAGNANAPTYTSPRKTCAWSAASGGSKALSSALSFAILTSGTIQGAFINYGSAATSVIDATVGTLFSAGTFSGGTRPVINGDTVNVSYSIAL